jgi:hypothetical protein
MDKEQTVKGNALSMAIVSKVLEHKNETQRKIAMKDLTKSKYMKIVPKKEGGK